MSADRNLEIEEVKRRTAELEQIQARNGQPALVAPDSGGAQRGSEERLRIATAAGQLGIFEWSARTHETVWENQRMFEIFGRSPLEGGFSQNEFLERIIHPEDAGPFRARMAQAALCGNEFKEVCRIRRDDGELRWLEVAGRFELDQAGKPLRLVGVIADITNRKAAEDSLRQNETRYRTLFEATRDGILIVDDSGHYVEVNQSFCEILKATRDQLIGAHFSRFIPPERLAEAQNAFVALQSGGDTPIDFPLRTLDGNIVELEWTSSSHYLPGLYFCSCRDISKRKATEEEARVREEHLRTLLAALPDVISQFDPNLRFLYVSPAVERTLGQPPEYFIGKTHAEAGIRPDLAVQFQSSLKRIFATGQGETFEFDLDSPDGGPRHFIRIGVPELAPDGSVASALSIVRDITERKLGEKAIRQSEAHYRNLAEALPQLVWTALPDGYCDYLSKQWIEYTGVLENEQLGLGWLDVAMHPDDREKTYQAWTAATAGRAPYDLEYRLRRHDGEYRWFKTRGTPVRDSDEQIVKWFGTCTDIDDRKKTEEERLALLRREREARAVAELLNQAGPTLSSELDPQALVQKVTDIATQITGAEFGALFHNVLGDAGESYMLYTLSGVPREAFAAFPMPRNTGLFGPTFRGEGVVRSADITKDPRYGKNSPHYGMPKGHLPVCSYLAVPVISRSGQVLGGLFFGHHRSNMFTEQHERLAVGIAAQAAIALDNAALFAQVNHERTKAENAREALQRANDDLWQANSDLEQFAYSASHDLQEPLRMVSLFTQMLQRKYAEKLDSQANEYINHAVRGANRMEKLVRDLLDYIKLTSGVERLTAIADSREAFENAITNLRLAVEMTKAKITHGPLPCVPAREVHLQQLFQNLVGNAIKYRSDDVPTIHVSASQIESGWRFAVQDNGIGIDPEYAEHVFGVFRRLHGNNEYEGTGIGLAICQKIVQGYGGRIWVESQAGRGSTFYFTIPLRNSDEPCGQPRDTTNPADRR